MKSVSLKLQRWLSALWTSNRPLTFVGLLMVCDVGACLVAMMFDSRQITGINAWIKPAKLPLKRSDLPFSGMDCKLSQRLAKNSRLVRPSICCVDSD